MKKNGDGYGTGDNRREEIKETRKEKDEGDESEVWEVMQEERKGMKREDCSGEECGTGA